MPVSNNPYFRCQLLIAHIFPVTLYIVMLILLRWFNLPVFTNNCSCFSVAIQIQSRDVTRSNTYNNFNKWKDWKCPGTCFFVFSSPNSICAVGSTGLSVWIYLYKLTKKEADTLRHRNTRGRCVAMAPPRLTDKKGRVGYKDILRNC